MFLAHRSRLVFLLQGSLCLAALGILGKGNPSMAEDRSDSVLRHVVLFQFKEDSSPEQVKKLVDEFAKLPSKIKQIAEFEYGDKNVSPEGLGDGFEHCFILTFRTEKDRDAYLPHKAHLEFVGMVKPHLAKVLVIDYWTKK